MGSNLDTVKRKTEEIKGLNEFPLDERKALQCFEESKEVPDSAFFLSVMQGAGDDTMAKFQASSDVRALFVVFFRQENFLWASTSPVNSGWIWMDIMRIVQADPLGDAQEQIAKLKALQKSTKSDNLLLLHQLGELYAQLDDDEVKHQPADFSVSSLSFL